MHFSINLIYYTHTQTKCFNDLIYYTHTHKPNVLTPVVFCPTLQENICIYLSCVTLFITQNFFQSHTFIDEFMSLPQWHTEKGGRAHTGRQPWPSTLEEGINQKISIERYLSVDPNQRVGPDIHQNQEFCPQEFTSIRIST